MAYGDDKSFKEVSLTKRLRINVGDGEFAEIEAKATQWYAMGRERITMAQARDAMSDCERLIDATLKNELRKLSRAGKTVEVQQVKYDRYGLDDA